MIISGDDWSVKHNDIGDDGEDVKEKNTFKPHDKDELKYGAYDLDYDNYGNIYLLSEEDDDDDDYDDMLNINVVKDDFGYKSSYKRKPNPFEKEKAVSKYPDANLMVNLIKGTENMQKPWVERPPTSQRRYRPNSQKQRWKKNPNKRRKTELKKNTNLANGARRFDQFAPNSVERKDFTSSKGLYDNRPTNGHKLSDVHYIDYFYY